MSTKKLPHDFHQPTSLETLGYEFVCQLSTSCKKIVVIGTRPRISNQLRHVNTIGTGCRDVTIHKRKIYNRKVEIISLIIQLSGELSVLFPL